jgi:hypothetical protein
MQRPWKYYRKMIRNIYPTVGEKVRGYTATLEPVATQVIGLFFTAPAIASKLVGNIMVTLYLSAFGRY